ncbi:cation transporter [Secundilactobacillus kimchicus]|uniref:cation transporter n=1 Tax=Secundilactobacillus kimchicus TaxID=528209 RepID=UPI0024A9A2CF|nr:cation transporter [Secundilactobacillus kimchicus]
MTNSGQAKLVTKSLTIEYLSVGWMTFEFLVGFWSGLKAGSILLIAFGLDSLLEIISGGALIWRLKKEANGAGQPEIERAERRSDRIVGSVLLLLAAYVTIVSITNLVTHEAADTSFSGMAIVVASVILMPILTIQKRRLGQALHSPALIEDGLCNITCAYMAATVLIGAILTALLGWWWTDSLAALVLVYFIASEGWEAFSGD